MFERYAESARRVIFYARYEAEQFGSADIDTQHLLLGILRQEPELLDKFLPREQLDSIRSEIEAEFPPQRHRGFSRDLPLSRSSKQVLAWAAQESEAQHGGSIDPAHLLAGLLREKNSFGASLLLNRGIDAEAVWSFIGSTSRLRLPARRDFRFLNGLRLFSLFFLLLFALQIAAKMNHLKLPKDDALFYVTALPAIFLIHLFLLWLALRYKAIRRSRYVQCLGITAAVFLLAIVPVLLSLFTPHATQP